MKTDSFCLNRSKRHQLPIIDDTDDSTLSDDDFSINLIASLSSDIAADNMLNKIIAICIIAILLLYIDMNLTSNSTVPSTKDKHEQYDSGGTYLRSIINSDKPFEEKNLPTCAHDVIITLHKAREEKDNKKEHICRGILIRDDVIITSSGCAENNFTFDFPGSGGGDKVEAIPYTFLNSKKEMKKSHLGFLVANPPYHYQFYDKPVRRNRVFLSRQSDISHTDKSSAVMIECDNEGRPILHNFPVKKGKKHEMIPISQLDGIVPDDILWEDTDRINTTQSTHNNATWWNRKITLEEGDFTFDRFEEYRGPPGSLSVNVGQLLEAVDPREHRRAYCYKKKDGSPSDCYDEWRKEKPFSGQHFFEWLDFGSTCLEKKMKDWNEHEVGYKCKSYPFYDTKKRLEHEVYITQSKDKKRLIARYKHDDEFVPESGDYHSKGQPHTYMWGLNKVFYIAKAKKCKSSMNDSRCIDGKKAAKHMKILSGHPALGAGEIYVGTNGTIEGINYSSGHYKPDIKSVTMMYQWMKDEHLNTSALTWIGWKGWSEKQCDNDKMKWQSIKIPNFDTTTLEQSCREVTSSPTWITSE